MFVFFEKRIENLSLTLTERYKIFFLKSELKTDFHLVKNVQR